MGLSLFQQLSAGFCPSVATYFRNLTYGAIAFPSGPSFQRSFDDYEVAIDAPSERRLRADVRCGEESLSFRSSRYLPNTTVLERGDDGTMLATAATRREKSWRLFSVAAAICMPGKSMDLHLFALSLPQYEGVVFQFSNDAGLREVDFMIAPQADTEKVTVESGLWRGHTLVCPLTSDPSLAPLLGAAGLEGASHLELQGYYVTSLMAVSRGLRLVFRREEKILCELPRRGAIGI